jgi:hypothetical protein
LPHDPVTETFVMPVKTGIQVDDESGFRPAPE